MIKKLFLDIRKTLQYIPSAAKGKTMENSVFFQKIQLRITFLLISIINDIFSAKKPKTSKEMREETKSQLETVKNIAGEISDIDVSCFKN